MAHLSIGLLGGLAVELDGQAVALGSRRTDALFAYLVLSRQPHSREHLGDLMWDAGNPAKAAGNLRVLLTNLRHGLGGWIDITRACVQFRPAPEWSVAVDVDTFRTLSRGPLRTPATELSDEDLASLEAAAACARGGLLDRLEVARCPRFDDWLAAERSTVQHQRIALLSHLAAGQVAHRRHDAAIETASQLVAVDPLAESSHRALIRARLEAGDLAGARRQFEAMERTLRAELGVSPSRETLALLAATELPRGESLRASRFGPGRPRSRPDARERAPWSRFVGRQSELAALVQGYAEVLQGRGTVAVVRGEGGSGKTMLLRQVTQLLLRQDPSLAVLGASCGSSPAAPGFSSLFLAHVLTQLDADASGPWLGASMPATVADRVAELAGVTDWPTPHVSSDAARLVTAVRHLSTMRPVVLVADDLHWADDATLQVLADLSQDLRGRPVLVLVGVRSEEPQELGSANRLLARISRGRSDLYVDLDHGPEEALTFVDALLASEKHALPESFATMLADLSGGHPQTAVELLRDLARRQVLDTDRTGRTGRFTLTGTPDWGSVPERVARTLDERLQELPASHSTVVEAAAVCGRQFDVRVVAAMCERPLDEVVRVVSGRLGCEARLFAPVTSDSTRRLAPPTHRFRHPLMDQHVRARIDPVWLEHLVQAHSSMTPSREPAKWMRRRSPV